MEQLKAATTWSCAHTHRHAVLEISSELPSELHVQRWLAEPIRVIVLSTSCFLTNASGFPVLSRRHQDLVKKLYTVCVARMSGINSIDVTVS